MRTNALAVANYLIKHAESKGERMSPMKLQKLVYYANGWYLAIKDEPLIDEQVEAWSYGPVIRSLYREFRGYGNRDIVDVGIQIRRCRGADGTWTSEAFAPILNPAKQQDFFATKLVEKVWDIYSPYSAVQLSNKTHEPNTPWRRVYDREGGKLLKGTDIPTDMIRDYFKGLGKSGDPL